MLCFDPTRGIDIGTKQQIYELVRELAAAGAAVLFYTSELKEIQLACDRAIVIFGGRIVAEIPVDEADEPTLLRAAYDLPKDVPMPEEVAAEEVAAECSRPTASRARPGAVGDAGPTEPGPRCPRERGRGRPARRSAPSRWRRSCASGRSATPGRWRCSGCSPGSCSSPTSSSRTTAPPSSRASPSGRCRSRWRPSHRPSSSSPAASTCRSAR